MNKELKILILEDNIQDRELIERELKRKGASDDDFEIAKIAYDRRSVQNNVFLVSNDYHLSQLKSIFEQDGIILETQDDELNRVKYN